MIALHRDIIDVMDRALDKSSREQREATTPSAPINRIGDLEELSSR